MYSQECECPENQVLYGSSDTCWGKDPLSRYFKAAQVAGLDCGCIVDVLPCGPRFLPGVTDKAYRCDFDPLREGLTINFTLENEQTVDVCCGGDGPLVVDEAFVGPAVGWTKGQGGVKYTVLLLNPDYPIPGNPILHALYANLSSEDLAIGFTAEGPPNNVLQYRPPDILWNNVGGIFKDSFSYSYMIFEQTQPIDYQSWVARFGEDGSESRFPLEDFVADNELVLVATNYFMTVGGMRWILRPLLMLTGVLLVVGLAVYIFMRCCRRPAKTALPRESSGEGELAEHLRDI